MNPCSEESNKTRRRTEDGLDSLLEVALRSLPIELPDRTPREAVLFQLCVDFVSPWRGTKDGPTDRHTASDGQGILGRDVGGGRGEETLGARLTVTHDRRTFEGDAAARELSKGEINIVLMFLNRHCDEVVEESANEIKCGFLLLSSPRSTPQRLANRNIMTSKDVRDIMQLGPAPTGGLSTGGKRSGGPPVPQLSRQPRPDGITRELYALIGDNNPSLAMLGQPALAKPKFKERNSSSAAKRAGPHGAGDDRGSKWRLIGFTNPCRDRSDAAKRLVLKHWVKDVPKGYEHGTPDTKFQKFNTTSQPFSYTDREYQEWLQSPEWTKEETDHLFGLAKEYDLRFIVMADRWEIAARPRSVDVSVVGRIFAAEHAPRDSSTRIFACCQAMKDRYYSICRTLAEKRPDPPISSTPGLSPEEIAEQKEKLDKQRQDTVASFSFDLSQFLPSAIDMT